MSVTDSREDLEAARARLVTATEEQLAADISFWSVACLDASADYNAAHELQTAARDRYAEAQEWTTLIAKELRSRREARVGSQSPTER